MKKNKFLNRSCSILLLATMILTNVGCTSEQEKQEEQKITIEPMEIEEVHSYSFDFIGGKDVMPLVGFYAPNNSRYSSRT